MTQENTALQASQPATQASQQANEFKAAPLQGLPNNTPETPQFRAAVGMSRKWDAREAGREVALDTLSKLGKNIKPDFFLLFSTIHYEKHGGFQELLNGVWDILPEGTPLIGGTVAGFINPQGCWTRGVTALAVNYPNMDVAISFGNNTKRNPIFAVDMCITTIKNKLASSLYKNKFLFNVISGSTIPQFSPRSKRKRVISNAISAELFTKLASIALLIFQKGAGREEEILSNLVKKVPDWCITGFSTIDDNNLIDNFQFFGNKVLTNAMVSIGISSNLSCFQRSTIGLEETNKIFNITRITKDRRVVKSINGKPAVEEFLSTIKWPKDFLDERIYRKTFFYPLGFRKEGVIYPEVIGAFLGKNIAFGFKVESNDLSLFRASGKSLLHSVNKGIENFEGKQKLLTLVISCSAILETLGSHIYTIYELMKKNTAENFLLLYTGGESIHIPSQITRHANECFNVSTLSS